MFVVFICKRTTLDKIIRYLRGSDGEKKFENSNPEKGKVVKNYITTKFMQFSNIPLNIPLSVQYDTNNLQSEIKGNITNFKKCSETMENGIEPVNTTPTTTLKKRSITVNNTKGTFVKKRSVTKDSIPDSSIKKRSITSITTPET